MFILSTISDLVQIPPHEFYKPSRQEVEDKINEKYSNKVIQNIGLCVCMYDLLEHSEGLIGHGTGFVNVNVVFRLVVFRPFKGEVITGRISSATAQGIKLSVEFFHDILVPPQLLFPDTTFDTNENVFVWKNDDTDLYFDIGETVRFRIEAEEWVDQAPKGPKTDEEEDSSGKRPPYSLIASMCDPGLGPTTWW